MISNIILKNNQTINRKDTFFIYDYETFGIDPTLDRPSQFSGIRTDYNFNPLEKPKNFFCQLQNDYLPNPEAILLTDIDPINSLNLGLKEYKFAQQIYKIFNIPKTCIIGYNNIKFDNEFTRNIFYRNFYHPFDWSWKNENSTWDLLPVIRTFYVLRPEGIIWPKNENGLPSFRLQDLSKSNKIKQKKTHDALSDVYTTLNLAKLMQHTQPKLFNYLYYYRKKNTLKKLINLQKIKPLLYIPMHSFHNNHIIWITPIGWHPHNKNILITCNLNTNLEILWKNNIKLLKKKFLINDNTNQEEIIKLIYINKCPILLPVNALRTQDITRLNINLKKHLNNFKKLETHILNNNIIKNTIISLFNEDNYNNILKNKYEKLHVDQQLYKRFFNDHDKHKINIIQNSSPEKLKKLNINFSDDRLQTLLFYYKARNFPNTLNPHEKNHWIEYKKKIFTQKKFTNYTKQLNSLFYVHKYNQKKTKLLISLIQYLKYIYKTLNK